MELEHEFHCIREAANWVVVKKLIQCTTEICTIEVSELEEASEHLNGDKSDLISTFNVFIIA